MIDTHQHFWQYDPQRDAWITDDMPILRRNYLPLDFETLVQEFGLEGTVAVQASESVEETDFLLGLAEKHPFIRGVVGWIDLTAAHTTEQLESYAGQPALKGFRHIIQGQPDETYFHNTRFRDGFRLLSARGYSYDMLIYHGQILSATRFMERFPDQRFMLDHLAKPPIRSGEWKKWRSDLQAMASNPNVFCKLSGLVTEADWKQWRYEDLHPYLEIAAECFEVDRLCFGSDWPVCLLAASYKDVVAVYRRFIGQLDAIAQAKVLAGNAKQFYKL